LISTWLHWVTSQKIELFITTAVRTSNLEVCGGLRRGVGCSFTEHPVLWIKGSSRVTFCITIHDLISDTYRAEQFSCSHSEKMSHVCCMQAVWRSSTYGFKLFFRTTDFTLNLFCECSFVL
jgi:hypothetical protein